MFFGWHNRPKDVADIVSKLPVPIFPVKASRDDDSLLYLIVRKVSGGDLDPGPQQIGDCTSWGWAGSIDLVQCIEIDAGRQEVFKRTATEAIYALERVEVGQGRLGREDGGVGAWCAEAVTKYGTLDRDVVGSYSGKRAKQWGNSGLSKDLEDQARSHLIKTVSQVTTADQVKQAIQNRYPVAICSNQGFTMTRDKQGFCSPRGTWGHCMKAIAYRGGARPGILIVQSWGENTPDGPMDLDQPNNSFWVELDVIDGMVKQGDSFTMSQFDGYPDQDSVSWSH